MIYLNILNCHYILKFIYFYPYTIKKYLKYLKYLKNLNYFKLIKIIINISYNKLILYIYLNIIYNILYMENNLDNTSLKFLNKSINKLQNGYPINIKLINEINKKYFFSDNIINSNINIYDPKQIRHVEQKIVELIKKIKNYNHGVHHITSTDSSILPTPATPSHVLSSVNPSILSIPVTSSYVSPIISPPVHPSVLSTPSHVSVPPSGLSTPTPSGLSTPTPPGVISTPIPPVIYNPPPLGVMATYITNGWDADRNILFTSTPPDFRPTIDNPNYSVVRNGSNYIFTPIPIPSFVPSSVPPLVPSSVSPLVPSSVPPLVPSSVPPLVPSSVSPLVPSSGLSTPTPPDVISTPNPPIIYGEPPQGAMATYIIDGWDARGNMRFISTPSYPIDKPKYSFVKNGSNYIFTSIPI
jgi:hypothetical protein